MASITPNYTELLWTLRCALFGIVIYCGLFWLWPHPHLSVPLIVGACLGASLPIRQAALVALLVLVGCNLVAPPLWLWFPAEYNEGAYLDGLNQQFRFDWTWRGFGVLLGVAAAHLGSHSGVWTSKNRPWLGIAILALTSLFYLTRVNEISPQLLTTLDIEPANKSYSFDGIQALKFFHLYQKGMPYHEALKVALEQDSRNFQAGFKGLGARSPVLFLALKQLPSPSWVAVAGWFFSLLTGALLFKACCKVADPVLSLATPVLFLAYFGYIQTNYWIFIQDPWVSPIFLCGVCWLILFPKSWTSAFWFVLALSLREFYVIGPIVLGLLSFRKYRNRSLACVVGFALCGALFTYNAQASLEVLQMPSVPWGERFGFSPTFGFLCLRFGSILILGRDLLLPVLFCLALLAPWACRRGGDAIKILTLQVVILTVAFFCLGKGGAHYATNVIPLYLFGGTLVLASQVWPGEERSQKGGNPDA